MNIFTSETPSLFYTESKHPENSYICLESLSGFFDKNYSQVEAGSNKQTRQW